MMLGFAFLFLASCEGVNHPGASPSKIQRSAAGDAGTRRYENDSLWIDSRGPGEPSVTIALGEQQLYFYKGARLCGMAPISTGREGNATQTGYFRITEMDEDHKSSLYGNYLDASGKILQPDVDTSKDPKPPGALFEGASMAHFMRIHAGTGMHEGFTPGFPDSHGCIRLPGWFAAALFDAVDVGTPVTVTR